MKSEVVRIVATLAACLAGASTVAHALGARAILS
jgi:hypothetical protein